LKLVAPNQQSQSACGESVGRRRIGSDDSAQTAKILKSREKSGSARQANRFGPHTRDGALIEQYYVAVDRQLKSGFGAYEAAEKAAKAIKKKHPKPQVTVFDAKKRSYIAIE
jgi:hypothetical protein